MQIPNDYLYDVFLSYKRNNLIAPWVTNSFFDFFVVWLTDKLRALGVPPPAPRVFFDQRDIEPGSPWPQELRRAIQTSKVLVAVCSPSYFFSSWCMSEWESFAERERTLGDVRLRIPIRHNDCEEFLSDIQWFDFYGYTFLARGFYEGNQGHLFEKRVEDFAAAVARAIVNAPPFHAAWPLVDGQPHAQKNPQMQRL